MLGGRKVAILGGDKLKDQYSLDFDGTNDFIDFEDTTLVDGLEDMTISMWVYPTDDSADEELIDKGGYNTIGGSFHLSLDPTASSGRLRFSVESAGGSGGYYYRNSMNAKIPINTWTHVVIAYSNTDDSTNFYINGVSWPPTATGGSFIAIPSTSDNLYIGRSGSGYYKGMMSDVAIYNANLSYSQVNTIYNGREPYNHREGSFAKNLISWWRMGDGALDSFDTANGVICDATDETLGPDLVTNGVFAADSGWTKGTGWTIGSGVATNAANNNNLEQDISAVAGACYKITLDISAYTSGTLYADLGGGSYITFSGAGTGYTGYLVTANTNNLRFYGGSFIGSIDNVVVQKLGGTSGAMINMEAADFVGDTP